MIESHWNKVLTIHFCTRKNWNEIYFFIIDFYFKSWNLEVNIQRMRKYSIRYSSPMTFIEFIARTFISKVLPTISKNNFLSSNEITFLLIVNAPLNRVLHDNGVLSGAYGQLSSPCTKIARYPSSKNGTRINFLTFSYY